MLLSTADPAMVYNSKDQVPNSLAIVLSSLSFGDSQEVSKKHFFLFCDNHIMSHTNQHVP